MSDTENQSRNQNACAKKTLLNDERYNNIVPFFKIEKVERKPHTGQPQAKN